MPTEPIPAPDRPAPDTGVLLINLGTPDAPTPAAVRRYLAEFLSDPRVVEQPRWLWLPVLHGVILRIRPARSAALYRAIWTPAGSPLQTGMAALAEAVQAEWPGVVVRHAMRYRLPDLGTRIDELMAAGVRRLLLLPLFPQYSATTTASVLDAVGRHLRRRRRVPELHFVDSYADEPAYVEGLAASVEAHWQAHGRAERLLLSFHGIPERYVRAGDPYADQCRATTDALRRRLGAAAPPILACFQSRVGREPWLQPYTDAVLAALPGEGVRSVQVLAPGFSIDCLETLEELAITNRERFLAAGGERYEYLPALNASPAQVRLVGELIRRHLDPAVP
ncbi:ferrochelatase [Dokdonella koreensis]|uniref:Ferrochelatase n=1 Tax=Dokdonella koreensis DS-123 TaxID=1300342 RepID=A0A167HAB8_9GAMM|nr:ferrochelatase [Dokdonella koreensis]ANB19706.1 Ferrochelatase [Dokdonella koreensis DS-123]